MSSPLDSLLNLSGVTVEGHSQVEGYICIHLKILAPEFVCPHCSLPTQELHQVRSIFVRDLPTFGQPVYLRVPRRQFYCRNCQKYVTQRLDFLSWRRRYTQRYESYIYQRVLMSNITQVSREEDLTADEVEGIFNWVSNSTKKKDWGEVKRLSMDEVSKRKGAKEFVTVVSDVERGCLLEVIDSHKQHDILETLKQQPIEVRAQVTEVSVDMWAGFPKVIEEAFPNAVVVIDRFHVMKLVNDTLNKIRRRVGVTAKGSKYLLLKNNQDLTETDQEQLEQILSQSACLRFAYEMKEEFREIYETSQTVQSGRKRMNKWLVQAQIFYGKTAQTIQKYLPGICNYFISGTTSGVMEGINNKIKLIIRLGYGLSNFDNLRSRLLGCCS